MGKHIRDNVKFYIVCAAFAISLIGNITGFGADKNQIDTNKVEISEIKKYDRIEHAKILNEIKEIDGKLIENSKKMEAVKAQNDLIIKLIQKKL